MARQIIVEILGDASKFSKATKDATTSAGKFSNVLKGVGMGLGISFTNMAAQAGQAVIDFAGDVVAAGIEEEASIQKLGTALRANIDDWDGNTAAIERVLKSRIDLGFSDDEQRQSLSGLVAATHDVTKALDIQRTAMDLARFKGISLADASEALTKVEAGSYRILKSLGIVLKDGATQTEALAAVQAVATGQAKEYAETTGGKLLVAQTKFGEKMDDLGTRTLPLVNAALGTTLSLMDLLGNEGATIPKLAADREEFNKLSGALGYAAGRYRTLAGDAAASVDSTAVAVERSLGRVRGQLKMTAAESDETGRAIRKDNRETVISYADFAAFLLGQYTSDFDKAMDIQEARADLNNAKTDEDRARAYETLARLGAASQKDLDNWLAVLRRMSANTKGIVQENINAAIRKIEALRAEARKPVTLTIISRWINSGRPGADVKRAATGGFQSGLTWVGEEGPELVNLPRGSYVNTASESRQMASSGGRGGNGGSVGAGVTVNVYGSIVGPSGIDELMDMMAQRLRLDGV